MSSSHPSSTADSAINEILDFWFEELSFGDWFEDSGKHDQTITARFKHLVEQARETTELDTTWLSTPSGSLAMIILLDQFSRNIYRVGNHPDPGLSFSGDFKALNIASQSIAKGFDRDIQKEFASSAHQGRAQRYFFYMPFMHAENLPSQIAAVSLAQNMAGELEAARLEKQVRGEEETETEKFFREWLITQSIPFGVAHRSCVAQLGRFPKRNEPLGRDHTAEEVRFLEEHPLGF